MASALFRFAFALLLALAASAALAQAPRGRVALLIGNNAYPESPLASAVHDARDLAAALRALGFTTIVRENATRRDMLEAMREFARALDTAEVSLFFYAGHAMQFKERNFLLPIDTEMRSEEEVTFFAVEVAQVLDRVERAKTRANFVILDACRNNPFASTFRVSAPGLAQPVAPSGTLVAYATSPGSTAAETYGRNGVYTQHLLKHVATPGVPVETVFKRVREAVIKETRHRQTPWEASSLTTEFAFQGTGAAAAVVPETGLNGAAPSVDLQLQIEREFWNSASASNTRDELQAYVDHYPQGKFISLARLRLEKLPPEAARTRSFTWPLSAAVAPGTTAAPGAIALAALFRPPAYADMQLSPEGKYIAALAPVRGRQNLVVVDVAARTAKAVTTLEGRDVVWARWVNARRLVFRTGTLTDRVGPGGGLFAIDLDGGSPRQLSAGVGESQGMSAMRWLEFVRALPGSGDDIIAQEYTFDALGSNLPGELSRVDTRSGRRTPINLGKPDAGQRESWIVDRAGVARVLSAQRRGRTAIHYRADARSPWILLDEFERATPGWEPLAIAADGGLLARSWRGRDKAAIVRVEPRAGAPETVIASHPYVDVASVILDDDRPAGIAYEADRPGFAWMDEELERIQHAVNAALPNASNTLSWSGSRERVLVFSASDVSAGSWYLFDRTTGRLEYFAERTPWLAQELFAPTRPVRYRARDDLEIPAYLTLPRGEPGKRHPLVILVHSGPWSGGAGWQFDPRVQFFATRGYAVLQPNYRGTLRYGDRHYRASFRQWGAAMHDDLVDGAAWAVARGHADPERICIAGSGYGGYAAVMALALSPGTFRCAIDHGGMTDLSRLLSGDGHAGMAADYLRYDLREMIGDPEGDRAALAAASPIRVVERLKGALLIAHGTEDTSVPVEHSERLRSALEAAGRPPRYLALDGEGREVLKPASIERFYTAVEAFLAEQLRR